VRIVPFNKIHIDAMILQEKQKGLEYLETDDHFKWLEGNDSFTALDGDEVLCCAGIVTMAEGRGVAWAYRSQNIGHRMVSVTRAARKHMIGVCKHFRIEMHVDCDFEAGHRWAKMLGFEKECDRMRAFTPDKRDCALYAMVKL